MHEEGRPLHIAYWKKARCLFWASTAEILSTSLSDAGLSIEGTISSLPVDKVYEFDTSKFWNTHKATFTEVKTNAKTMANRLVKLGYKHFLREKRQGNLLGKPSRKTLQENT